MASDQQLKTGTTTIGLVNKEGVVLASERRATMGNFIAHKDVQKVYMIDDNLGLTTAGLVGDAQLLARYVKAEGSSTASSGGCASASSLPPLCCPTSCTAEEGPWDTTTSA
jgi:20S proteasome alpha/beta subunit